MKTCVGISWVFFMRLFRDILGVLRRLEDGFGGGYGV